MKKMGMMQDVRPACRADIKSLCSDVQPGGGRVAMCITSHEDKLSAPCRDAVTKFPPVAAVGRTRQRRDAGPLGSP